MATHYRWVLDWAGPSGLFYDESNAPTKKDWPTDHDTLNKAKAAADKILRGALTWSKHYDHASRQPIEDALSLIAGCPDEGRTVTVCTDTVTGYKISVRIRREVIPEHEWLQTRAAKMEAAKARADRR